MHRTIHRLPAVVLCLGMLLWGAGAGAQPPSLIITAQDSGKTLALVVGQRLTADLQLAGDETVAAPEFDASILALRGQNLQSLTTSQGSSVRLKYEFAARKAGETDLVITVQGSKSGPGKALLNIHLVVSAGTPT